MYKVLVFAGTVEGRTVAEYLNQHRIPTRVCVATEYGESLLPQGENLIISHDRLTCEQMEELMQEMKDGLVIDATHPYAEIVTENIQKACENTNTKYFRVVRGETSIEDSINRSNVVYVKNIHEAVEYLEETKGNILVTTGSKELSKYTALADYQERIFARVLSLVEVVNSCSKLGIEGKHLICMQGPFSKEMNVALIHQLDISWMVTKESGAAGGFLEKYLAAKDTGCSLVIIGRPKKEEGSSLEECLGYLKDRFDIQESDSPAESRQISLVGIGMGTDDTLTMEAKKALDEAQVIIGAGRMLKQMEEHGKVLYNAYKPEVICQFIKEHPQFHNIAIALSGDVGFYSGAKKLISMIKEEFPQAERKVYCGISSMIYFCGKLELPWDDVKPISLHGLQRNVVGLLKNHPKIFAIVGDESGAANVCKKLVSYGMGDTIVSVGERLSYADEKIVRGSARDFQNIKTDALSVILLENSSKITNIAVHGIPDEEFLRDKVPMTKEEVRSISLSKLQLKEDSVIYDIGAGTGSVSIEMALRSVDGIVYAIEKKETAIDLIRKNKEKFRADNLVVIEGLAPEACVELPVPTHAFIGGSSGNLCEILELLLAKNPKIRVVINCITLETVSEAISGIKALPVTDIDIAQINVAKAKKAGAYHLMMGQNPVYVISFTGNVGDAEE
ncbi:MAG: precorrin-6A reductase [Clostridia bacterium]|nr:precorrin-6A reductase [Clostridia bacterium]